MLGEHLHHWEWIYGADRLHEAVVLIEGFDHMNAGLVSTKGWTQNPTNMQTGRFSGQAARQSSTKNTKLLASTYATLIAGVAVRGSGFTSGTDFFFLQAGATATVRVSCNASGFIQIRNSGGTVIATGTTSLATNTWYYIEVKAFINGASGTVEVKLNGVAEIASTTGNFGSTNLDTVAIVGIGGQTTDFDDMYIVDTSGAAPRNTFLGDVRVVTIYPNADGANTAWTPSSGSNHYDRVNEASGTFPDGDTTYVSSSTPGQRDTYVCDDVDSGATVIAVQRNLYARKDDAGTRQIAPVTRQGGTNYDGTTVTLSSSYLYYSQIDNQDPTGTDWTAANVNADEFGVKAVA